MSKTIQRLSSRAQFIRGAIVGAMAWFIHALRPASEAIAGQGSGASTISVDLPKIGSRWVDGEFLVFNSATDGMVILNEPGRLLWQQISEGTTDVDDLIQFHARSRGQSQALSAYHVISFLDELSVQGIIKFSLPKDKENAPLLDVSLSATGSATAMPGEAKEEAELGLPIPKPPAPHPPRPPKPPPKPPFGKSRSACKTACV